MEARKTTLIRADAAPAIGSGHVMRCIALAEALQAREREVVFACAQCEPGVRAELQARGLRFEILEIGDRANDWEADAKATLDLLSQIGQQADWIIVDHYGLDARWHQAVAASGARIAVVDDLADRKLHCQALVNQNATPRLHARYLGLVPPDSIQLLGPEFTLLRAEFLTIDDARRRDLHPVSSRTLVFMGGADLDNLTMDAMLSLQAQPAPFPAAVLVGALNANRRMLGDWCAANGVEFHDSHGDVGRLLVGARLAVVACGMFGVELQALGVPSVLVPLSDIQREVAEEFEKAGTAVVLERQALAMPDRLADAIALAMRARRSAGPGLIPFDGASRVVDALQGVSP